MVCEKALTAVAFLCRHSEENKQSVCLENCKGFGIAGVCELIVGAIKRHGDERKIVEAAADAMRCLCALSSNRERLGGIFIVYPFELDLNFFVADRKCWSMRGHCSCPC